jgi:secreted trypsin-like serine protease
MRRLVLLGMMALAAVAPARASAVVGGANVPDGSAPYAVALLTAPSPGLAAWQRVVCGGSIIGPDAVLTAAHCVAGAQAGRLEVLAGRTNLLDGRGQRVRVASIAVHPRFDAWGLRNDVAVLRLAEPVASAPVRAVAPGEEAAWAPGMPASVLGWGALSERQRSQTAWLQAGVVPIRADPDCQALQGPLFDPATQLCAGPPDFRVDACLGDSGGPLVVSVAGAPVQVGIVSSGRGCGRSAGVYTRIGAPGIAAWIAHAAGAGLAAASAPAARPVVRRVRAVGGGRVEVRGRAPGAAAGTRIVVQRRVGTRWVTVVRSARCGPDSRFRAVFRAEGGRPRVRALVVA